MMVKSGPIEIVVKSYMPLRAFRVYIAKSSAKKAGWTCSVSTIFEKVTPSAYLILETDLKAIPPRVRDILISVWAEWAVLGSAKTGFQIQIFNLMYWAEYMKSKRNNP